MWKSVLLLALLMGMGLTACGLKYTYFSAQQVHQIADAEPRQALWDEVNKMDPGPIPKDWQAQAEAAIRSQLRDPYSAYFRFNDSKPIKIFFLEYVDAAKSSYKGSGPYYANHIYSTLTGPGGIDCLKKCEPGDRCWYPVVYWLLTCEVNSKNKFGGYTGYEKWWMAIKDSNIYKVEKGDIYESGFFISNGRQFYHQYYPDKRCDDGIR